MSATACCQHRRVTVWADSGKRSATCNDCNADLGCADRDEIRRLRIDLAEAVGVVTRLVRLKDYKDRVGKDANYAVEQPKAWADARSFLARHAGKDK